MENVAELLNRKFLEWQMATRKKQTIRSFAKYLDVKETSLSGWMNTNIPPKGDNLIKLSNKLGYEIYDILGIIRPDKRSRELQEKYNATPEERKDDLLKLVEDWLEEIGAKPLP